MPTPAWADTVEQETENIVNKSILRTQLFAEKFYPARPAEAKNAKVVGYEQNFLNNPQSSLFRDTEAAALFAAMNGLPEDQFKVDEISHLEFARAVVIVPVKYYDFEWGEGIKEVPYICTHQRRAAFRDAQDNKVHLNPSNSRAYRPATDEEVRSVVEGIMDIRPAGLIKNLGNSLDGVDLGEEE